MEMNEEGTTSEGKNIELFIGVLIAVFAAILSINDLGGGRYGDDEMIAHKESAAMYEWSQAKSIKSILCQNQLQSLTTLEVTNTIKEGHEKIVDSIKNSQSKDIARYKKEMDEIRNGSANIDKKDWVIKDEKTGALGNVTGAAEWKAEAEKLGEAGDKFDLASLFLQICIVFGAISLVIQKTSTRKMFLYLMIGMGIVGTYFMIHAYSIAMG
ncbi:DUF4337 domain-containing protein [Cytophaga hutchinsonii]|uniref:DUF4337 domain-containing protein n=1 Tax=Cytophaga hutchinsonii TaxID=985 RepID=UPI000038F1C5|nr:DUF4337 domain-containing protein [Cytophaga hutchinsonii]SFX59917.1 protein of unknown function [Cytophaga hutchinsonii ATCC 33406]